MRALIKTARVVLNLNANEELLSLDVSFHTPNLAWNLRDFFFALRRPLVFGSIVVYTSCYIPFFVCFFFLWRMLDR